MREEIIKDKTAVLAEEVEFDGEIENDSYYLIKFKKYDKS